MWKLCSAVLLSMTGAAADVWASSDDCEADTPDCVAVGRWNVSVALGAGIRTNPLHQGQDLPLAVVPEVSYYGSRFYLDNFDLGVTALDRGANTVSVIATPGYDRIFFYRSDLQNVFVTLGGPGSPAGGTTPQQVSFPSRTRRITYLAGPEWTFNVHDFVGQFDLLREVTGQNHGEEVRGAVRLPLIQSPDALSATLGFTWQSAAIVNYFYGAPGIYDSGSVFRPFAKLAYRRPLRRGWHLEGLAQFEHLGRAIADSPIVAHDSVVTTFLGFVHEF